MQRIEIIGHLADDARKIEGRDGKDPFVSFSVAVNERKGDATEVTYYEATYRFNGTFEHLKKGKQVFLDGTPNVRLFTNREGQPVARITVRVNDLRLL